MEVPKIVEEFLPANWYIALSSAIAVAVVLDSVLTITRGGVGSLLETRHVRRVRTFFVALIGILALETLAGSPAKAGLTPWIPVAIVGVVYGASEGGFRIWLRSLRRRDTLLPVDYLRSCVNVLRGRQTDDGGFRVKGGVDARSELWTSAQVIHGLVGAVDRVDMAGVTDRSLDYLREELKRAGTLWTAARDPLIVSSAWTLLAMTTVATSKHWENIGSAHKEEVREWIREGVLQLANAQTGSGAWTSLGSQRDTDIRSLPTVVALWAIAGVIAARSQAEISEDLVRAGARSLDRGWRFLRDHCEGSEREMWWDPNPQREWRQRSSALTLLTYGVLLAAAKILEDTPDDPVRQIGATIREWSVPKHDPMMRNVDHCLHRGLEDNEADDPWDHLVQDRDGRAREVPITYFDWPTSALFALRLCKVANLYDISDATRERELTNALIRAPKSLDQAYSFRLAMILISTSVNGPVASL